MAEIVPLSTIRSVALSAGYPAGKTNLIRRLRAEGIHPAEGPVDRGQRGFLFDRATLPAAIRDRLPAEPVAPIAPADTLDAYLRAPASMKAEADRRVRAMLRLRGLLNAGSATMDAYAAVAAEFGDSVSTVRRAWKSVRTAVEGDWIGILTKAYKGSQPAELDERVWKTFLNDFGRVEQPTAQACWERTVKAAKAYGWGAVPSVQAFVRRWNAMPVTERVLMRDGEKALGNLFPYAERDRSTMLPLDGFNIDGRTWDLFVQFPDGEVMRPTVSMVQDEATNYLLGWIVGRSESTDMYRRVLCEAFTAFGVPTRVLFDNTRAAANKALTAGAKRRNRFKDQLADIEGLLPRIGCDPQFAMPENGRSKLVERGFGEIKERSEKDPRLAGAYAGRSPSHKPANYGERAVPLALFEAILAEAVEHYNTRVDRRSKVAHRTSHKAVFDAGMARIAPRRLTARQRRIFFMLAERRTVTPDGAVKLGKEPHVNRYRSDALREHRGQEVVVRYDPDNLTAPVMAETLDGVLIDDAVAILEKRGFNKTADAREYARAKREEKRNVKKAAANRRRMDAIEAGENTMVARSSPAPAAPIVKPDFKRKPAVKPAAAPSVNPELFGRALALLEENARLYG